MQKMAQENNIYWHKFTCHFIINCWSYFIMADRTWCVLSCIRMLSKAQHNADCLYDSIVFSDSLIQCCLIKHTHFVTYCYTNQPCVFQLRTFVHQSAKESSPFADDKGKLSSLSCKLPLSTSIINLVTTIICVTDVKWRDI